MLSGLGRFLHKSTGVEHAAAIGLRAPLGGLGTGRFYL